MKLIRPITITDAVLTSSTVIETAPAAYAGGTTYALSDTVGVAGSAGAIAVYTSLQAGNIGHTPASSPTWWALTGNTYGVWSSGTTYALGDRVIVVGADSHHAYESLQATNLNKVPATQPTWWLDLGATNRWKMFDGSVTSQTSNPSAMTMVFAPAEWVNTVALLNISTATARVVMTDPTDGVVYDQTRSMISDSGIADWYAYFFEPIERLSDLALTDLPLYTMATLTVTLTDAGSNVLCGACIPGLSKEIGGAQYGATVGIQDYSVKQRDTFGNYSVLERAFAKRASFRVFVKGVLVDRLLTLLAGYRATPIVYIGSESYAATIVYGFYKDFNVEIAYPEISVCSLEIEGLT